MDVPPFARDRLPSQQPSEFEAEESFLSEDLQQTLEGTGRSWLNKWKLIIFRRREKDADFEI